MDTEEGAEGGTYLSETSPYVAVRGNNGNEMIVRKSSVCWLLSKDKYKLSSDRLVRVQEKEYSRGNVTATGIFWKFISMKTGEVENLIYLFILEKIISDDSYIVCNEINIGDWCLFFDKTLEEKEGAIILLGLVLGFTYMDGETFKKREFSKTSASILSAESKTTSDRQVGVLCTFYTYSDNGLLLSLSGRTHSFVNIANYAGTIKSPIYSDEKLTVSQALLVEIEKLMKGQII